LKFFSAFFLPFESHFGAGVWKVRVRCTTNVRLRAAAARMRATLALQGVFGVESRVA